MSSRAERVFDEPHPFYENEVPLIARAHAPEPLDERVLSTGYLFDQHL